MRAVADRDVVMQSARLTKFPEERSPDGGSSAIAEAVFHAAIEAVRSSGRLRLATTH